MGYSIKVLSDKDFESLPYSRVSTSLGVADPEMNTAYIRYSVHSELNQYLINHEFDHLIEENPTDEFEGVRYKDMGSVFGGLGKVAQTAGPLLSLFNPGVGAATTLGGSFLGGKGAKQGIASGQPGYGQLSPNQLSEQNEKNSPFSFLNPFTDMFKSPGTKLGSALLGTGLNKNFPKVPALPQSVEELRSRAEAGGGPMAQFGGEKLKGLLGQQFQPLNQPEIDASLRQLNLEQTKAEDQVRDLYRNIRPGSDPSSDSSFRRDVQEVQDQFARAKSDTVATRTRDVKSQFDQQRLAQIQLALGADAQEMSQLSEIAQLDINQIMAQLNIDYASALNFKQVFQELGGNLLLSGMNSNPLFGFNVGG